MTSTDEKTMTERDRAAEKVRAIVEELDRPTLALLYKTLHDAFGTTTWNGNLYNVMKQLIEIRNRVRK